MERLLKRKMRNDEKKTLFNWLQRFGNRFETAFIITEPKNEENPIVFVNHIFTEITGYSTEEVHAHDLRFLFGQETDMDLIQGIDQLLSEGKSVNNNLLYYKKDGTPFWCELVIQPLLNEFEQTMFNISFMRDVTDQRKDEILLKSQEKILSGINKELTFKEIMKDVFEVVESFLLTGGDCLIAFKDKKENWSIQSSDGVPEMVVEEVRSQITNSSPYLKDEKLIIRELKETKAHDFCSSWSMRMFDSEGEFDGVFIIFTRDVVNPTEIQQQFLMKLIPVLQMTKTFFEQQREYRELAYTDQGTNLPNSHAFLEKLGKGLRKKEACFVAIIEPSELSQIVDLYGRDAADELFIQLARRVEKMGLRKKNYVARFSSSSLIVLNRIYGKDDGRFYTVKLKEVVSEPFIVAGEEMLLTMKAGISICLGEEIGAQELIRRADLAVTAANRRPGHSTAYYGDVQNQKTVQEMTVFNELTRALVAEEIEVYLQPKVDLKSRKIVGFEALARWHSPVIGQVTPDVFIAVAESIGKIIELEKVVLKKVLKWQKKQLSLGNKMYQIAVNISVDHFLDSSFIETLKKVCSKYGVDSQYIRLEIIESIGLVDFEKAKLIFNELREARFDVSIDDFGVGYSSLSYLPQLNVNELKIDRSFIEGLDEPNTYAVVMTIIQLANNLNLSIVAEGIEEERHIDILISLGCHVGQGFYFYRPMPLEEIDLLLEQH